MNKKLKCVISTEATCCAAEKSRLHQAHAHGNSEISPLRDCVAPVEMTLRSRHPELIDFLYPRTVSGEGSVLVVPSSEKEHNLDDQNFLYQRALLVGGSSIRPTVRPSDTAATFIPPKSFAHQNDFLPSYLPFFSARPSAQNDMI